MQPFENVKPVAGGDKGLMMTGQFTGGGVRMNNRVNSLGQPVGYQVPHWKAVNPPPKAPIDGRYCRIEPIDVDRHAADLFEAISDDADGRTWTYMGYGPFATLPEYRSWMKTT